MLQQHSWKTRSSVNFYMKWIHVIVVPGGTAIKTEQSKAVLKLKPNISKELKSARKINLCCDIWSKKGMTESYLGVTAYFFTNHQRCKATLAVRHFEIPHTGDRIHNIAKVVLNDWDISCNQVGKIVTDNGSNMLKAFKETVNCSNDDDMTETDSDTESDVLVVNLPESKMRKQIIMIMMTNQKSMTILKMSLNLRTMKNTMKFLPEKNINFSHVFLTHCS